MPSLWLISVAGSREGTVQLAQEQDDGLFVHHGGCPFTVIIPPPLDLTSAATFCSLATLWWTGHFPSGNVGEQVAVTARARMGHGLRQGLAEVMAARFSGSTRSHRLPWTE
jgi:hypothetical protein